jgi:hypothetical protein
MSSNEQWGLSRRRLMGGLAAGLAAAAIPTLGQLDTPPARIACSTSRNPNPG